MERTYQIKFDEFFSISIIKNGTYKPNSVLELTESSVFRGDENPIMLTREYDLAFYCDFNLAMFPFDTQYCFVEVEKFFNLIRAKVLCNGNYTMRFITN